MRTQEAGSVLDQKWLSFQSVRAHFETADQPVEGFSDFRTKELGDGTQITFGRYESAGYVGEKQTVHFNINVTNESFGGLGFVVTKNGLTTLSINGKQVSLRSHMFPRSGENFRVSYEGEDPSKSPQGVFREAAVPLTEWMDNIIDNNKFIPPPVTIVEKTPGS